MSVILIPTVKSMFNLACRPYQEVSFIFAKC